jgi:hypothetical protein
LDEIELQLLKALLQRFARAFLIVIPQLGGDEEFIARQACAGECFAYTVFVFVGGRGVD